MLNCESVKLKKEVLTDCQIGMEDKCVTLLSIVPSCGVWKGWDHGVALGDVSEEYLLGWIECFVESSVVKEKATHTVTMKLWAEIKRAKRVTIFSNGSIGFPMLN